MAYKEFHVEKTYEAPDVSHFLDNYTAAVTSMLRSVGQQAQQRRKSADQFKYDLTEGKFENDTKILSELAKNVSQRAKGELRSSNRLSTETDLLMKDGLAWQQISKNQFDRAEKLTQNITQKGTRDPYYNAEPDIDLIKEATHGNDNDVDFRTRGERLSEAEKNVGGPETFRFNKFRAQYVKDIGTQSKKNISGTTGGKSTIYNQATFWDDSGKPGVTDKHAVDFLEADRRVSEYYNNKVGREIASEIDKMKASGDKRVAWMKGLDNKEIGAELISNPSKNIINSTSFGERVRTVAKDDLKEADRINSEISYDRNDTNNSGGRWSNNNVLHTESMNQFSQQAKSVGTGKYEPITTYGPGGRFTQKNGKAIQIDTMNPVRTDINKGVTTKNNKGALKLNLTGYQLMPVKKGGAPFALKSSTLEDMIEEVKTLPLEYFNPEGNMGLQSDLKIGLNGYTINEANVLGDVNDRLFDVSTQMHDAQTANDADKLANLQNIEYNLNEIKTMVAAGDYNEGELLLAANKAGVRKTKEDWIIPADSGDVATIRNVTGGFNLSDKSYWSEDMRELESAYKERYAEAKKQGFSAAKQEEKKDEFPTVANEEEYSKLPVGAEYMFNGKKYTKQPK